jgi:hypothetical protein
VSVVLLAALLAPAAHAEEPTSPPPADAVPAEPPADTSGAPSADTDAPTVAPDGVTPSSEAGAPSGPPPAAPDAPSITAGAADAASADADAPPRKFLSGVGITGTEDLRVRWWQIPETLENFEDRPILDYVEVVQRIDLRADTAEWGVGARADAVALFGNRYILDGVLYQERDPTAPGLASPFEDAFVTLEKVYLERRGAAFSATLGDSYVSFGRGLALNLVKSTEIDVDTSLRGLRGALRGGSWEVTVASGITNPQQMFLENPNIAMLPDDRHAVTGLRADVYGAGPFNLGVHGTMLQFADNDVETIDLGYAQPVGAVAYGGTAEAFGLGGLDVFLEVDGFSYGDATIPVEGGHAAYASVSAYPGNASILIEARRAYNAEWMNVRSRGYELAIGPTLEYERVITEDSAAAVNSNDITGGRARVDLRLGEGEHATLPYASVAVFRDADTGGLHFNRTPETIAHAVVGAQVFAGAVHAFVNGGYRVDARDSMDDGASLGADRLAHIDADLQIPIAGPVTLEIAPAVIRFDWGVNAQQQTGFVTASNSLALKVGTPWAFILYNDFSDDPLIRSTGNISEHVYAGGEVQWMPNTSTTLKAFYGAYRAGIRCAGGQCRMLPGFEGLKFALTTTF